MSEDKQSNDATNATNDTATNAPIKLKHPFTTVAGAKVEQVQVKGISVRQMKQAQRRGEDDADIETAMVAIACDLVLEDMDDMQMIDFVAVRNRFQSLNFSSAE